MSLRGFKDHYPEVEEDAYIDPAAVVIGKVQIGSRASVWPGAVLRGDEENIHLGPHSAVLDNAVLEAPKGFQVKVDEGALVSHAAVVHGGEIGPSALAGINSTLLEGASLGPESILGSGAVVPPGKQIPPGKLALGIPAKVVRDVSEEEIARTREEVDSLIKKLDHYTAPPGE